MPEPQQHHIWAMSRTYTTAHGKARSSTHWVRPGIKLATSWLLVGSASAAPWWELQQLHTFKIKDNALENALEKKWPKHLSRHFINDQGKGNEYETTSLGNSHPRQSFANLRTSTLLKEYTPISNIWISHQFCLLAVRKGPFNQTSWNQTCS